MAARILVVDDESGMRLLGRLMLEERGLEVDEAASGAEALDRCAAEDYSVVVLDYKMPGVTGLDVVRGLRERGDQTPVVLYSGYIEPGVAGVAAGLGARLVDKSETEALVAAVAELTA